jgi:ssDNA-binding Zn-finger/Zn-ribbon topoisomerase 1
MKYAALIFGDDDRQPKAASAKLPSPEPGQIVRGIDGSVYRVASKIAGPDGYAVKLANLQGQPVQTPHNFRPVAAATARFAAWLKYHLAYNRDFDLYINSYIERYNEQHKDSPLPFPVGRDGQAFRWANWFQSVVSPKLYVPGRGDVEDQQIIKDELIHEMLFTVLGHRDVLAQFVSKAKSLGVNKHNAATKLTDFLISTFMYRIDEMQNKLQERMPEEEISMYQSGVTDEGEGEVNILDSEEHAFHDEEFQSVEAKRDVAKFREGFSKWLGQTQGQKAADSFILMFDIFWRILQTDEDADVKRSDLEQEWIKRTGLSFGSFKDYFGRLPDAIEQFITSHSDELGDKNIFVDLMNVIRNERTQRERKDRRHKERARPAMVSSLNTAGVEGDFTEAISNTENPDVVDPDIHQPTESVSEAAKVGAKDEKFTCMKCHRTSNASDSNNLQCPHCGGNMKEAASKTARLIRGDQLTPDMIRQVQDAFIYRWTSDNKRRGEVYHCDKCDVRNEPYVNTNSAEGHQHPTIPLQTDEQWLKEHAFSFTNAGRLQPRRHAQPAYLVPEEKDPILASVAHKFAMEKAAYNPGKGEYIYQADVYCEACGDALKRRLDKKGYTPANPSDEASYDSDKYPKGPYYNQESDGPEHCARCGEFLENPLTTEGYQYLNQMILEHEEDGKGQSDIIDEWKAFYPEREQEGYAAPSKVDDTLSQIEQDTDKDFLRGMNTAGKKAMLPHEFNDADGQAISNETYPDTAYVSGQSDTTEFREPRVGAKKTAIDPSSILDVEKRTPTPLHKRPQDPVGPTHPLQTREAETGNWQCMDCGAVGLLDNKGGGCETCGSQAVFPVSPTGVESPELVRETKPVEVEKRMIPRRSPKPLPLTGKKAQGSGNTTVTMQEQNVTTPNTPGKGEPMAVPEAIDQAPGPHSPNAPMTAPRTPGITPKIVNVPPGTEGEMSNMASADPEEITCPKCHGSNVEIDAPDPETYKIWCDDCDEFTYTGGLVSGSPVRDYREMPGDEWSAIERMGEVGGEFEEGPEPDVDAMYEAERLDQFDKQSGLEWIGGRLDEEERAFVRTLPESEIPCPDCGTPLRLNELSDPKGIAAPKKDYICPKCESVFEETEQHTASDPTIPFSNDAPAPADELSANTLPQMNEEEAARWLEKHGWVKENDHHGATWWMGRQMWYKKDYEESIPYQDTDDAVEKELELMDRAAERSTANEQDPETDHSWQAGHEPETKQGAGSNSGNDDDRGAGDLWRENFYEHRTTGPSTNGLLTGMKDAAAAPAAPPPPNVQQQMNLVRPQVQAPAGPGGTTVAIMPSEEDPGNGSGKQPLVKKHTVEPELPNAKYHMMGALVTAEEHRLMADAGLSGEIDPEALANPEMYTEEERKAWPPHMAKCEQCGLEKPDVQWRVSEDFSSASDPTQPAAGWLCEDCDLDLAQDI